MQHGLCSTSLGTSQTCNAAWASFSLIILRSSGEATYISSVAKRSRTYLVSSPPQYSNPARTLTRSGRLSRYPGALLVGRRMRIYLLRVLQNGRLHSRGKPHGMSPALLIACPLIHSLRRSSTCRPSRLISKTSPDATNCRARMSSITFLVRFARYIRIFI